MALAVRTNGSGSINLINATWFNDIRDLLTGVMTDQPVTIANTVTVTKLATNGPLTAGNQVADLQQGFGIYSDNAASTFAGASTRLWFQAGGANGTQEMHFGPRSGGVALAGLRILANNVIVDSNGSGSPGVFKVQGGVTTSLDAGTITTDGQGTLRLTSKWLNWQGTLGGSAKQMFGFSPTDVGAKSWGLFYNTDGSISFFDATDNKTSLRVYPSGGFSSDSSALSTDGSGNLSVVSLTASAAVSGASVTASGAVAGASVTDGGKRVAVQGSHSAGQPIISYGTGAPVSLAANEIYIQIA